MRTQLLGVDLFGLRPDRTRLAEPGSGTAAAHRQTSPHPPGARHNANPVTRLLADSHTMSIRPPPPRAGIIRGAGRVRAPTPRQPNQDQDGLAKLSTAVNQIQNHNASALSFEEHYRHAYQLVCSKFPSPCARGERA